MQRADCRLSVRPPRTATFNRIPIAERSRRGSLDDRDTVRDSLEQRVRAPAEVLTRWEPLSVTFSSRWFSQVTVGLREPGRRKRRNNAGRAVG